jgi:hypothetical protein
VLWTSFYTPPTKLNNRPEVPLLKKGKLGRNGVSKTGFQVRMKNKNKYNIPVDEI